MSKKKTKDAVHQAAVALLRNPLFLHKALGTGPQLGIIGEERNIGILFLTGLSKDSNEPVSVILKGPSSSGKSSCVGGVLKLFPPESVITRASLSPKALAHGKGSLKGKIIYVVEYRGAKDAEYLLRLQQSEGEVLHEFTTVAGRWRGTEVAHRIGIPVVFTTTTSPKIFVDSENRFLSISVDDSPLQTLAIAKSLVSNRPKIVQPRFVVWHEAIRELGRLEVTFANDEWLGFVASKLPAEHVRVRRDWVRFLALLKCIAKCRSYSHAAGVRCKARITFEDYCVAYILLNPAFTSTVHGFHRRELDIAAAVRKIFKSHGRAVSTRELATELEWKDSLVYKFIPKAIEHSLLQQETGTRQNNLKHFLPGPNAKKTFLPSPQWVLKANPKIGKSVTFIDPISGCEKTFRRK